MTDIIGYRETADGREEVDRLGSWDYLTLSGETFYTPDGELYDDLHGVRRRLGDGDVDTIRILGEVRLFR